MLYCQEVGCGGGIALVVVVGVVESSPVEVEMAEVGVG